MGAVRSALGEAPAGAGWAEAPRQRGPGLRGLRASRPFAGAALASSGGYLDVNGNPVPGYYTGVCLREEEEERGVRELPFCRS